MRVVQVHQFGSPEVLRLEETEEPQAGHGQVVIEVQVAGVCFGDTLIRSGKYPLPLPWVPGLEVAGRVREVGPDGDRTLVGKLVVARTKNNRGGYAELSVVDATDVFPIPTGLDIQQAVGVFLSGQTAVGLIKAINITPGEVVLITAAAGSLGSQLIQQARAAGAGTVIGAAYGKKKLDMITQLGADVAIDYSKDDWVEQVRKATNGKGADLVLDGVGGTIGHQAFEATTRGSGRLGVYGFSSGAWAKIETRELAARSITIIAPLAIAFAKPAQETHINAETALAEAATGKLRAVIGPTYPLSRAADAHTAIEARQTTGKVLLIP
ncbi:NADPH:quinone oxidoreductase [Ktedonobacter sp. SOSP1-85]|uniref:zinc-binding dehydrogenase n=1 Tax=Ktedonobacter sp. SOSP1-85 TaxID=2778367 RepID=UPI001916ADF5|nr:zinc-binding dehydrogenase [Ktedonobacter sp. SOSP1-85]GHO81515.1 NADPH:quinone oxidoreductase [Ktedonobacter sp. SOSP1-85]